MSSKSVLPDNATVEQVFKALETETAALFEHLDPSFLADYSVFAPSNRERTRVHQPPELLFAFGESYTTTENVEVTLSDFQAADTVAIENNYPDSNEQVSPPTGERFVLVNVEATAVGRSEGTPFAQGFSLRSGSKTFEQASAVDRSLVTPAAGPLYSGVYDPDEGETFSGYLVFTVPQQMLLGQLTVEWTSTADSTGGASETAHWTKGGSSALSSDG